MAAPCTPVRRGFSRVEALTLTVVGAVVLVLLYWVVSKSLYRARHGADFLTCSTRLNQMHKGLILWANDHDGRYPLPMDISTETAARGSQPGNSTANLHSFMIFNAYYGPETVICPQEPNRNVVMFKDYDFGTRPGGGVQAGDAWDVRFSADLEKRKGCNVSYANLALVGGRLQTEWADSLNADYAVFSDRGPRNGQWDDGSLTLRRHGARTSWLGNVAYNDGHVAGTPFAGGEAEPFVVNGDNLFLEEDADGRTDMWLSIFAATTESASVAQWD